MPGKPKPHPATHKASNLSFVAGSRHPESNDASNWPVDKGANADLHRSGHGESLEVAWDGSVCEGFQPQWRLERAAAQEVQGQVFSMLIILAHPPQASAALWPSVLKCGGGIISSLFSIRASLPEYLRRSDKVKACEIPSVCGELMHGAARWESLQWGLETT